MPKKLSVSTSPALDTTERKYMQDREKIVSEGVKANILAAKALHEIMTYKDGKLWQAYFPTFRAYCRNRWGYAKSYAYELADSGEVILEIEAQSVKGKVAMTDWMPTNASHLRPLKELEAGKRGECWQMVVAQTKPVDLTQKIVKVVTRKFAEDHDLPLAVKKAKRRMSDKKKATSALGRLKAAVAELPDPDKFKVVLEQFKVLIG